MFSPFPSVSCVYVFPDFFSLRLLIGWTTLFWQLFWHKLIKVGFLSLAEQCHTQVYDDDLNNEDNLKNEDELRNEEDLINEANIKNIDHLKNENHLKNEDKLKNEDNLKNEDDLINEDNLRN